LGICRSDQQSQPWVDAWLLPVGLLLAGFLFHLYAITKGFKRKL
jgi:hypothetical protein